MIITPGIELTLRRCGNCNRYYSHEGTEWVPCPVCQRKSMREADQKHAEEVDRLMRSNRALRGTLMSRKKKAK